MKRAQFIAFVQNVVTFPGDDAVLNFNVLGVVNRAYVGSSNLFRLAYTLSLNPFLVFLIENLVAHEG